MMNVRSLFRVRGSVPNSSTKIGPFSIPSSLAQLVWGLSVIAGLLISVDFQTRPARCASAVTKQAPDKWPQSVRLDHDDDRPIVLMFVHPYCSCSRASVGELAAAMASADHQCGAYLFFYATDRFEQPVEQSELWRQAARIPGVSLHRDMNGEMSRTFGAYSSGTVVAYDRFGRLAFAGGITPSRGHVGPNLGGSTIADLLRGKDRPCQFHDVYGCSLTREANAGQESIDEHQD